MQAEDRRPLARVIVNGLLLVLGLEGAFWLGIYACHLASYPVWYYVDKNPGVSIANLMLLYILGCLSWCFAAFFNLQGSLVGIRILFIGSAIAMSSPALLLFSAWFPQMDDKVTSVVTPEYLLPSGFIAIFFAATLVLVSMPSFRRMLVPGFTPHGKADSPPLPCDPRTTLAVVACMLAALALGKFALAAASIQSNQYRPCPAFYVYVITLMGVSWLMIAGAAVVLPGLLRQGSLVALTALAALACNQIILLLLLLVVSLSDSGWLEIEGLLERHSDSLSWGLFFGDLAAPSVLLAVLAVPHLRREIGPYHSIRAGSTTSNDPVIDDQRGLHNGYSDL
jgi:hypothetical protein